LAAVATVRSADVAVKPDGVKRQPDELVLDERLGPRALFALGGKP
jgi:hypothetical protein